MQPPLRRLLRVVAPGGAAADVPSGSFAIVMATGIVSIAAALNGMARIATALFVVNLIAFPALWLLLLLRLRHDRSAILADLRDHQRGPSLLTLVVGSCVLSDQFSLLTVHQGIAAALWLCAVMLSIGLIYCPFALTIKPVKPPLDAGLDGSWLLVVVTAEAIAISAARAVVALSLPEPMLFAGLCLFSLGAAFYSILLTLIVYRWLFWPMRPEGFALSYWINMGAAAITTLAGTRLLPLVGADPVFAPLRGFVGGETVISWSFATWWIPLLFGLTIWRCRSDPRALTYRLENWSIVFPLGMYTAASWHFARAMGLPFLTVVPQVFVWVAITAWCLTFGGMLRHIGRQAGRPNGRSFCGKSH